MPVESVVTGIADLNAAWPLGSDQKQYGDDHIRNIKAAVKTLLTKSEQLGFTTIEHTLTVPTTNITFAGVVQRGSQVVAILQQDATGGRQVTWDAVFDVTPAPGEINLAPNGLTLVAYVGRSNGKLTCYSVRTGAALIPALGNYGAFLMDNSGVSGGNPRWERIPLLANVQIVPGGSDILLSNVGNWDYRLLRVKALHNAGVAPFFLKIRKDTSGGGSAYITATDVICNQPSGPPTDVLVEQRDFTSLHTLYVEASGFSPGVPFMVCVAYEPFGTD